MTNDDVRKHYDPSYAITTNLTGAQMLRPETAEFMARGIAAMSYYDPEVPKAGQAGTFGVSEVLISLWQM